MVAGLGPFSRGGSAAARGTSPGGGTPPQALRDQLARGAKSAGIATQEEAGNDDVAAFGTVITDDIEEGREGVGGS